MIQKKIKRSDLDGIKKCLIERKIELEERFRTTYVVKNADDQIQDSGDQALFAELSNLRNSLEYNDYSEYQMIIKALDAINDGEYGYCMDCGSEISEKRLVSYPNATRCILCQEKFENFNNNNNKHFV